MTEKNTSFETKQVSAPRSSKAVPIGVLTRQLVIFQQKVQQRSSAFAKAVAKVTQNVLQSPDSPLPNNQITANPSALSSALNAIANASRLNNGQNPIFQDFVKTIDVHGSAQGSFWSDIAECWFTLVTASKLQELGITLNSPDNPQCLREFVQKQLFKFVLSEIADEVVFGLDPTAMDQGFVDLTFRQPTCPYAAWRVHMDALSRFLEIFLPLNFRQVYDAVETFYPDPSKDPATPDDTFELHANSSAVLNYSRFTLTSLQLRIQVLETKQRFWARVLSRTLFGTRGFPDAETLRTIEGTLCHKFSELVYIIFALAQAFHEVLLQNRSAEEVESLSHTPSFGTQRAGLGHLIKLLADTVRKFFEPLLDRNSQNSQDSQNIVCMNRNSRSLLVQRICSLASLLV